MRIKSVRRIRLPEPVPVYDVTVPITENFALAAGPFVHNSKDVADALAAALFALSTKQVTQPLPIMRGLSYTGDAWMEEQRAASYAGNKGASHNTEMLPAFIKSGGGGGDDGGWSGGGMGGGGGWFPG